MEEILRHPTDLYTRRLLEAAGVGQKKNGAVKKLIHISSQPLFSLLSFGSVFRALVAASPPYFRRWYSRIAAFPSRGRCPKGADRVTMA